MTIGVPMATTPSAYIPGSGSSDSGEGFGYFGYGGSKPKPRILNKEVYTRCREKCLLEGDDCLNNCLCSACWKESIGGQLLDYCRCLNPDVTDKLHF
jgi:hypothetical protein